MDIYITDENNVRETVHMLDESGEICQDEDEALYCYFEPDKNVYDGETRRGISSCAMTRAEYDYVIKCIKEDIERAAARGEYYLTVDYT